MAKRPKYTFSQLMAETELPMFVDRDWMDMPSVGLEIIDDVERAADFARRSDAAALAPVIRAAAKLIEATTRSGRAADARAKKALDELQRAVAAARAKRLTRRIG